MSTAKQENLKSEIMGEGLWNIYKPKGISSFDVVRDIKRMTGEKKVGHAGTLDPLAEGVLIVGVGREATKQLRFVLEEDKEYIGEIKLGMVSTTDDGEGEKSKGASKAGPLERSDSGVRGPAFNERTSSQNQAFAGQESVKSKGASKTTWPSRVEIKKVIQENFIGDIIQISPVYSAIKIGGERAYKKARRGEKFTSPPRIVTIKEIEILEYSIPTAVNKTGLRGPASQSSQVILADSKRAGKKWADENNYPILKIRAVVGSGTYIRSIAREIGEKLGVGGYLTSLVRTRIGNYKIEDAINLKD